MELEKQRGISITSAVVQFPYRDCVVNLLDTPGHRDFSEDTYRVLAAADAAVMVLDAAKGIEPQTLKLFDVCRQRGLPLLTFINKWDRPGRSPLELLDEIEKQLGIVATPVTWPVGIAGDFRGVVDCRSTSTRGSRALPAVQPRLPRSSSSGRAPRARRARRGPRPPRSSRCCPRSGRRSTSRRSSRPSRPRCSSVRHSPTSACASCSTRSSTSSRHRRPASTRPACRGLWTHRSRASCSRCRPTWTNRIAIGSRSFACVRVGSSAAWSSPTTQRGKPFATKYAHQVFGQERETIEEAFPGDVIGLVNANDVKVGDTLWLDDAVTFPTIPSFAPEHFRVARVRDTARFKQFRRGIAQLDEEGVVQVLRDPEMGDQAPILAAVGPMQYDVALFRLENEFGAPVELSPTSYNLARRTDSASAEVLRSMRGAQVLARADGTLLALFESQYWVERLEQEHPELVLDRLVAEGSIG